MSLQDIALALIQVLEKNDKMREAIIEYIKARARAENELAEWRSRRGKK